MRESLSPRERVRHALRSAALVAGHLSEQAVRRAIGVVRARFAEDSAIRAQGRKVVDQVSKGADIVIEKSPVPIPQPVQEAMGRMQDALGQLSHAQDLTDLEAWERRTGSHAAPQQHDASQQKRHKKGSRAQGSRHNANQDAN